VTFHEVRAKSALNHVPRGSAMPFDWTVNPSSGLHTHALLPLPDTPILLADGRHRLLGELSVGDRIIGTQQEGTYRRYITTSVLAKWTSVKRAYRVTLADGTEIVASADHRFLTERGWKHVKGTMSGRGRRPYLTTSNRLMGFGRRPEPDVEPDDAKFRRGYLSGMIRGDGMIFHGSYDDGERTRDIHRFRLALADHEALDLTRRYLADEEITVTERPSPRHPRSDVR
jgi:hypothetical protein